MNGEQKKRIMDVLNKYKRQRNIAVISCMICVVFAMVMLFTIVYQSIQLSAYKTVDNMNNAIDSIFNNTANDTNANVNENIVVKLGETATNNTWKITLLELKQYDTIGEEFVSYTADEGKTYVIFIIEVENISDTEEYFNSFYFKAYEDDYTSSITTLLLNVDGYSNLSGNVDPNKKMKGYIAMSADTNWQEIGLSYDDGVFVSNKLMTFVVTPSDITN